MPSLCDINQLPLDDIEDLTTLPELQTDRRALSDNTVQPKAIRISNRERKRDLEIPQTESIIPGTQKIYLKTWGCTHNNSDSEYMAGQLASYGYTIVDDENLAALWLLNSCTVKNPAEDGFRNAIKKASALGKRVVLAGCVPQGQPRNNVYQGLSVIGVEVLTESFEDLEFEKNWKIFAALVSDLNDNRPMYLTSLHMITAGHLQIIHRNELVQQIDRVVEVVEETLKGHTVRLFGKKKEGKKRLGGAPLDLPKIRKNPLIEIIAINTGCLNQCTYCKTKHARGDLGSYPPEEIVDRAKQSFQEGVVELWITSEDTGAYGRDIGTNLPELLWQIVEVIPEGGMMRLGMTNPPYILEHLEEMARLLDHPKVYSFLHVPVQSGSNGVLTDMKREYFCEDFRHVCNVLKERVPHVTIATDVICGFPTETEEDFEETLKLVEDYKFPSLFINQFYPRPGTPAARMKRIPTNIVKERSRRISKLFQSYFPYQHKLHETQRVLITEESKDGQYFVGHNKCYDQVLVPKEDGLMGKMVDVLIVETGKHFMKAELIGNKAVSPGLCDPLPKGAVSGIDSTTPEPSLLDSIISSATSRDGRLSWWISFVLITLLIAITGDMVLILYKIITM